MHVQTLPVGYFDSNCYIVHSGTPHSVVIDPGDKPDVILAALERLGLTLSFILLTHAHFDHFLAAPALQKKTGAPVYVQRLDLASVTPSPPADLRPLDDCQSLEAPGLLFAVRHTPGHSPGSCCFVCQNAIFSGDTLFRGDVGRVDLKGGDAALMRRTLATIAAWDGDYDVYPGHGPSTTLSEEQRHNPYLQPPHRL